MKVNRTASTQTLNEALRLHSMGWAIHWLAPKSKRPLDSKWTTGERKSWKELKRTYRKGYNIGVRTGRASKIGKGYLACIDVDVKTDDPGARAAALKCLKRLTKGEPLPEVRSGAGNGSRHLYCVTKEPFPMITVEKCDDWEICVYSDGRQMVLPPSVHPSGRPYVWKVPLDCDADQLGLTLLEFDRPLEKDMKKLLGRKTDRAAPEKFSFRPVNVAIEDFDISDRIADGIRDCKEVPDRSAFLLPACSALVRAGATPDEVLSVLTDPGYRLGQCAYDHAKTTNRQRAGFWLWKYTLKRVLDEESAEKLFDREAITEDDSDGDDGEGDDGEPGATKGNGKRKIQYRFYKKGKRGGRSPDYEALMGAYELEHPFKTIADMRTVFLFRDTHYDDTTPIEIKGFAEEKMFPKPEEKVRAEFQSKIMATNIARRAFFTESTEGKVNFKNGVLDLNQRERELAEHSERFGFRGVLPYDYDPEATCPVFKSWLRGVMLGDRELFRVVQEYMGYIVRGGEYKYHKALWLGGVGRNGKSTFVDLLKALIGQGNFAVLSIKTLISDKFAGASLDGKIANFSEETSPEELQDSGPFKNLTGDGDIFAQKKYGDPYYFRNRAKLIMTYNQIPNLKDITRGMMSRPIIIPFEKQIQESEQDQGIKSKLFEELPGIFNFALRGWDRLERQGGFTESLKSSAALEKIRAESCSVRQWISARVEFTEEPWLGEDTEKFTASELYDRYRELERYPYKFIEFSRRLHAHPFMAAHCKVRGGKSVYFGLKIGGS